MRGSDTCRIKDAAGGYLIFTPHSADTPVSRGVATVELDGALQSDDEFQLADDGQTHTVRVVLGEKPAPAGAVESESQTTSKGQ